MPYDKIKSGPDKGKYRSVKSGRVRTLPSIRAEHAKKRKKMAKGGQCRGGGKATSGTRYGGKY